MLQRTRDHNSQACERLGGVGTAARGGAHSARAPGLLHGVSSSGLCGVEMRILKFKSSLFYTQTSDVQPLALPASLRRPLGDCAGAGLAWSWARGGSRSHPPMQSMMRT